MKQLNFNFLFTRIKTLLWLKLQVGFYNCSKILNFPTILSTLQMCAHLCWFVLINNNKRYNQFFYCNFTKKKTTKKYRCGYFFKAIHYPKSCIINSVLVILSISSYATEKLGARVSRYWVMQSLLYSVEKHRLWKNHRGVTHGP